MVDHCLKAECYELGVEKRACRGQHFVLDSYIKKVVKAFGGCLKCYGKGYSTVQQGLRMAADFEGDEDWETQPRPHIKPCDCQRGKDFIIAQKLPLALI